MTDERPYAEWSDAEKLACVQHELQRVQNLYSGYLARQSRYERDARTAARRSAQEDRLAWAEVYLGQLLDRTAPWLRELIYRVEQLSDRVSKTDLDALRQCAGTSKHVLTTYRAELASRPDYGLKVRTEELRLRTYVVDRGRALHARATDADREIEPNGLLGACRCAGCELIRGMDDVEEL